MTVPILRTSERATLKRCPQKWYWAWRMGLVPVGSISDALAFGGWVHVALAGWYCGPGLKRGPHPAETFEKVADTELRYVKTSERFSDGARASIEEKLVPMRELGLVLLNEYVEHYGEDEQWDIIQPEMSGQVDIMDPDYPEQLLVIYGYTYDLVFRDLATGRIWLGEHKTAASISLDHLPLDDQAGSYWAVATPHLREIGALGKRESLAGIMYNFLRKALPDPRPRNADGYCTNKPVKADYLEAFRASSMKPAQLEHSKISEKATLAHLQAMSELHGVTVYGEVSKLQPKPLFVREAVHRTARERETQIRRIANEALLADAYRTRALPLTKTSTRNCYWDCQFYDMCLLDEQQSADVAGYRRSMYRVEDPYAQHRKSTEEPS